ncbi:hypothetical protein HXK74_03820, partial [Candidatus Gracilibacteria bacterium]|jgi:hypothetical protein|nr:hypothetical protein [Candidatus Gracilibacteria bacterium]
METTMSDFSVNEVSGDGMESYDTSMNYVSYDESTHVSVSEGGLGLGILAFWLAFIVAMIASGWKIFTKAKLPGWGILVPIYNVYLQFKLAGHPNWAWWLLLPPVAAILLIVANFKIAKKFGKGTGFALGLWFLPIIFYPILAWGDAQYQEEVSEEQK